jgi:hypothetical protein
MQSSTFRTCDLRFRRPRRQFGGARLGSRFGPIPGLEFVWVRLDSVPSVALLLPTPKWGKCLGRPEGLRQDVSLSKRSRSQKRRDSAGRQFATFAFGNEPDGSGSNPGWRPVQPDLTASARSRLLSIGRLARLHRTNPIRPHHLVVLVLDDVAVPDELAGGAEPCA